MLDPRLPDRSRFELLAQVQREPRLLERVDNGEEASAAREVLVVDDVRDIFALSSVLERHRMEVSSATNGRDAIELAERSGDLSRIDARRRSTVRLPLVPP